MVFLVGSSPYRFAAVSVETVELSTLPEYARKIVSKTEGNVHQMKEAMALSGLKEPVFEMNGFFRAIFFRPKREDIFPMQKGGEKVGEEVVR